MNFIWSLVLRTCKTQVLNIWFYNSQRFFTSRFLLDTDQVFRNAIKRFCHNSDEKQVNVNNFSKLVCMVFFILNVVLLILAVFCKTIFEFRLFDHSFLRNVVPFRFTHIELTNVMPLIDILASCLQKLLARQNKLKKINQVLKFKMPA